VYFQNTATKDMRLQYRDAPTKRETVELEGIHSDAWINADNWQYTKKKTQARFIQIPIWKFCTPRDVCDNYTRKNADELATNMAAQLERLIEEYGVEPSDWLYNLNNLLTSSPETDGEGDKLPF
jgi:hypothetical protein